MRIQLVYILVSLFLGSSLGCSTSSIFKRRNYQTESLEPKTPNDCKVAIIFQADAEKLQARKLGSIEASEPGFGIDCQEDFVLQQFVEDACKLGSNVIHITDETRPNFWSTCYRAKADFLLVSRLEGLSTDPKYHPDQILKRSQEGHKKTMRALGLEGSNKNRRGGIWDALLID